MKKKVIAGLFFLIIVTTPIYSYSLPFSVESLPGEDKHISLATGGFILFEWGGNHYVLADTRSGRVWKLIGSIENPDHFESIRYENSKGDLVAQPENEPTNQFPGRFAFKELGNKNYVLDTVTGNLWMLQGTYEKPVKLTPILHKD